MSDAEADQQQQQQHTKKRKRVSKKMAKKNMNREDRIARNRDSLKKDFEKERNEILEAMPDDYKAMLGQIGFAKWSKNLVPVLILSPFDLPPGVGSVREQWMHMYEKLSSQGRLANLSYVIYFYGSETTASPYSFIQQTKFIPYEKEKAKTEKSAYQLPVKLQKKIEAGAKISGSHAYLVTAYEEMEEDLQKPAEDRKRGITDFKECYDVLSDHELDLEISDSEGSDDNDDLGGGGGAFDDTTNKNEGGGAGFAMADSDEDNKNRPATNKGTVASLSSGVVEGKPIEQEEPPALEESEDAEKSKLPTGKPAPGAVRSGGKTKKSNDGKEAADPVQPDADAERAGTTEWKKAVQSEFEDVADKVFDALVNNKDALTVWKKVTTTMKKDLKSMKTSISAKKLIEKYIEQVQEELGKTKGNSRAFLAVEEVWEEHKTMLD